MTPSSLFSKIRYASSISFSEQRWVIRGVVSIFPSSIRLRISAQSQPSTPPVLKVKFLPSSQAKEKAEVCHKEPQSWLSHWDGQVPRHPETIFGPRHFQNNISSTVIMFWSTNSLQFSGVVISTSDNVHGQTESFQGTFHRQWYASDSSASSRAKYKFR